MLNHTVERRALPKPPTPYRNSKHYSQLTSSPWKLGYATPFSSFFLLFSMLTANLLLDLKQIYKQHSKVPG